MKKKRLAIRTVILVLLAAAVAYTLYASLTKEKRSRAGVGEIAPDFVLMDLDGTKHRLSDYKGQGVFLNFWGTWCKPCEKEMPYMNNQYKQFKDRGVQVLAVNIGESNLAVQAFSDKYQLSFPIVLDKDRQVMNAYGVGQLPATFLVNKEGKIVRYHTGQLTEQAVKQFMESIEP
ncbi:thiol-disulfide oxidoreductase ResA [Neobacillus notoginsengisoli]|uniref:Thiol-disulfide oxidoreductase ResA n=1 Tax=Neobacillus notoginsengisoli TaxID=1578198 RepID=A0A417YV58_9BACI|nr:thiol-disulfide oxidoreductase ResA [Neobacillus notoginsengisoli]RHW41207.1 thiol-disulfide oxidoreductase ResA [Neobacillus notoginsengisoli]